MHLEVVEVLALAGEGAGGSQHWSRQCARPRYSLSSHDVAERNFVHSFTCFDVAERVETEYDIVFAGRVSNLILISRFFRGSHLHAAEGSYLTILMFCRSRACIDFEHALPVDLRWLTLPRTQPRVAILLMLLTSLRCTRRVMEQLCSGGWLRGTCLEEQTRTTAWKRLSLQPRLIGVPSPA